MMKILTRITKLELNNLFYSPLAWLAMLVFTVYCGSVIVPGIEQAAFRQGLYDASSFMSLTDTLYTFGRESLFNSITTVISVLIPLVAMGVISREASSGTIKMLYSSPIKVRDIVIGKFLAITVFVSLFMLIMWLVICTGYIYIESFDIVGLIPGFVGLYLLSLLIASITVYISTFSSYPVIDVLGAIAVVYGIGLLYNQVRFIPVVSEIVYWLDPTQQLSFSISGLLLSRTVLYFVLLILLFLIWAYFKMRLKKETIKGKRIVRVKMLGALCVVLGGIYLAIQPQFQWYKDFTKSQVNLLSPLSQKELAHLKDTPITITTYVDMLAGGGGYGLSPADQMFDKNNFYKYQIAFPQIAFKYVYYYNPDDIHAYRKSTGLKDKTVEDVLNLNCEKAHIDKSLLVTIDKLPKEVLKYRSHRQNLIGYARVSRDFRVVEVNGKRALLEIRFDDNLGSAKEAEITAAFKSLSKQYNIGFIIGHEELGAFDRSPQGLSQVFTNREVRGAYINNGFSLLEIDAKNPIASSVDVLVIARPKETYTEQELANINTYISTGKHVLVLGDAGLEDIINPITTSLGVTLRKGMLANDSGDFPATFNAVLLPEMITGNTENTPYLQMPKAGALKVKDTLGFKTTVLAKTDRKSTWLDTDGPDELGEMTFEPQEKQEVKSDYPVLVALNREINGKQQKIFISGDADFLSNDRALNAPAKINTTGSLAIAEFLSKEFTDSIYPLSIEFPEALDKRIKIPYSGVKYLKLFWYVLLPGVFLFFGIKILRVRLKK